VCEGLVDDLECCHHNKLIFDEQNTYIRTILSLVSCIESRLGMCNTLNLGVKNFFLNIYQIQVLPLVSLSLDSFSFPFE
jgi:hypothetical protein